MSDENKEILDQVTELITSKKEISKENVKDSENLTKLKNNQRNL